jgi:hypothetical protein
MEKDKENYEKSDSKNDDYEQDFMIMMKTGSTWLLSHNFIKIKDIHRFVVVVFVFER